MATSYIIYKSVGRRPSSSYMSRASHECIVGLNADVNFCFLLRIMTYEEISLLCLGIAYDSNGFPHLIGTLPTHGSVMARRTVPLTSIRRLLADKPLREFAGLYI